MPKFISWIPTQPEFMDTFFQLCVVSSSDVVYDLGSGDGRLLFAALEKGAGRCVGIDIDPERVKAPLIRHHHEWYGGTGYPDGLKGQEIPLGSRIICIAEAYDTMVTPRSYGNVMSGNEALIELEHCSGTQFDPEIIKVVSIALSPQTATDN